MRPGQASKLFGCVTFLDQGVFGRIARSGLNALKDRQYSVGAAHLTADLLQAFDTIECVLALKPRRAVPTLPHLQPRVLAASDAAQDGFRVGSGGFLVVSSGGRRVGAVVPITSSVFDLWASQETKIAQLELLMVLQGLLTFPSFFRRHSG